MIDYDRNLISDSRVQISVKISMEPHPVSPYGDGDFGYQAIRNTIHMVWKDAVVAPGMFLEIHMSQIYILIVCIQISFYNNASYLTPQRSSVCFILLDLFVGCRCQHL